MQNEILQSVPIDKLVIADDLRKAMGTVADQHALSASIKSHGLINPITVRPGEKEGDYIVVAGARRFRALKSLIKAGEDVSPEIPCVLYHDPEKSVEAGLAENMVRADMHPMDEADTFARLEDAGIEPEAIASRFGIGVDRVKRRLRLASIAPEIKDAYRQGEIYLDHAQAFTLTADHERQVQVLEHWRNAEDWEKGVWHLRDWITDETMPGHSHIARYVGLKAYKEAGGAILEDLFTDDEDDSTFWIEDSGLMSRLANEKLQRKAKTFKKKAAWVEAMFNFDHGRFRACERAEPEAEGAGVVLKISHEGKAVAHWLIAPKDEAQEAEGEGGNGEETRAAPPPAAPEEPKRERNKFSESLREDLKHWRGLAVADQLKDKLAIKVLIFQMASLYFSRSSFDDYYRGYHSSGDTLGVKLNPHRGADPTPQEEKRTARLRLEWLECREKGVPMDVSRFEAFMQLSDREHNKILAEVSRRLVLPEFTAKKRSSVLEVLVQGNEDIGVPGVELAGSVPPTADDFWKRMSLPVAKELATRYLGEDWFTQRSSLKKGQLCVELEQAFKGRDDFVMPGFVKGAPDVNALL